MNPIHTFPGFAKGKRDPSRRKTVQFADFVTSLPTAPLVDYIPNYNYPMDGNDVAGDCVIAEFDHFRQIVTGLLTGTQKNFTQEEIWAFYRTQNPNFNPNGTKDTNGPGSNADGGIDIQIFLEYLVANKYILGFASVDFKNESLLKAATYIGLSVMAGVQLQEAQIEQFASGTWDYVAGSPIDGGHGIPLGGFNNTPDIMDTVSWAKILACTMSFIKNQMDECWFVLMQEHVDHPGFRNHFDLAGFSQAVSEITGGKVVIPVPPAPWPYPNFPATESTGGGHTCAELKPALLTKLQQARTIANIPYNITSGVRTPAQNAAVGGKPDSAHLTGEAADIACSDAASRWKIVNALLQAGFKRLEIAKAHVHADVSITLPQAIIDFSNDN